LRVLVLLLLALVIAKPQIVDSRSKVPVSGIDIVLVLDVSGSMQFRDYDDDERSRFDVAKAEAIRFIEKRDSDALGLVLFGKDTVSRCPITFDKQLLKNVVDELNLGVIDSDGTMLVTGMVTAANRLKHSQSSSKVMIVLTDGEPSEGDMDPSVGIEVAKAEASRFIEKRINDALGLVLFGKDTVSRCPITFDKELLQKVVEELKLGVIDADGTMLITGIVTAANRLKHSRATSKVMIVLTDGEPSEGDMDPSVGIDVAKKLGIKIYTVGIGSEQEQIFRHPLYGIMTKPKVNKELLTKIAGQTGGHYFLAHSAADMRRIYDTIDTLEKTEHEVPMFSIYYDLLMPFVAFIMAIIFFELFFSTYIWFAL